MLLETMNEWGNNLNVKAAFGVPLDTEFHACAMVVWNNASIPLFANTNVVTISDSATFFQRAQDVYAHFLFECDRASFCRKHDRNVTRFCVLDAEKRFPHQTARQE